MKTVKVTILAICFITNQLWSQPSTLIATDQSQLVAINSLLKEAGQHLGTHYRAGGKSPAGFDCSGFIGYCFSSALGIKTPASSSMFYNAGQGVSASSARPGDVICFTGHNSRHRLMGHVAIVTEVTPNEIYFIHSAANGGIRYDVLSANYYRIRFMDIRRFF